MTLFASGRLTGGDMWCSSRFVSIDVCWRRRVHTVCAQDTNALCFDTIPAAIGASVMHGFDVCGSGVPRVPIAVTLCVSVCGHR